MFFSYIFWRERERQRQRDMATYIIAPFNCPSKNKPQTNDIVQILLSPLFSSFHKKHKHTCNIYFHMSVNVSINRFMIFTMFRFDTNMLLEYGSENDNNIINNQGF